MKRYIYNIYRVPNVSYCWSVAFQMKRANFLKQIEGLPIPRTERIHRKFLYLDPFSFTF